MEKEDLEHLFDRLKGQFDTETPEIGHQKRFLAKLEATGGIHSVGGKGIKWWKPLSIAASIAILSVIGINQFRSETTLDEKVAEISPEVSRTEFYFASLIGEQIQELEGKSTPETRRIIDDTMVQLKKLENDYEQLEQDLINGGNSKLILSAMITNFQTRMDLLKEVLSKIETIKKLKNYNDANATI